MFVFVTSLYNLSDVRRGDGRDWQDYLDWFGKTLRIKAPLIIFTEPETVGFIDKMRDGIDHPTYKVITTLEEVPLYHLKESMQEVLDSDFYKENMNDTNRVECNDSMYSVIQYSKFKWLKESTVAFDFKYYFWLDAGASRFIDDELYENDYPSEEAIKSLENLDDTFLIQYNDEYYPDLVNQDTLSIDYLWDNRAFICGSMFGGNKNSIHNIDLEMDSIMDHMIANKCLNNEQIALGFMCKAREELFTRYYRQNPHRHLDLFQELA